MSVTQAGPMVDQAIKIDTICLDFHICLFLQFIWFPDQSRQITLIDAVEEAKFYCIFKF